MLIEGALVVAFALGAVSGVLRRRKVLGLTGAGLATLAALLGGGGVRSDRPLDAQMTLGLDWFQLNLFLLALIYVPFERAFARRPLPSAPPEGPPPLEAAVSSTFRPGHSES